jgi:hypothetical protein
LWCFATGFVRAKIAQAYLCILGLGSGKLAPNRIFGGYAVFGYW